MKKATLIDEINAYAEARVTRHPLLMERQMAVLQALLAKLPDELPEVVRIESVPTASMEMSVS